MTCEARNYSVVEWVLLIPSLAQPTPSLSKLPRLQVPVRQINPTCAGTRAPRIPSGVKRQVPFNQKGARGPPALVPVAPIAYALLVLRTSTQANSSPVFGGSALGHECSICRQLRTNQLGHIFLFFSSKLQSRDSSQAGSAPVLFICQARDTPSTKSEIPRPRPSRTSWSLSSYILQSQFSSFHKPNPFSRMGVPVSATFNSNR